MGLRRLIGVMLAAAGLFLALALPGLAPTPRLRNGAAAGDWGIAATGESGAAQNIAATPSAAPGTSGAALAGEGYLAVWVSYLEWQRFDFSGAAAFSTQVEEMVENIAAIGGTVILAHLRPFGDALYPSKLYPFSHLCSGVQGRDPGFDPLEILLAAAHARGLQVEGWVNPYRLQAGGVPALCEDSVAYTHPDWVKSVDGGLYLDPGNAAVRQYIADGLAELCENYALDGIHFDDYFYPTTDPAFDAADYSAYCQSAAAPLALEDWRRSNVDALVALCWRTVHRYEGVRFGIAPQGDPDINYAAQYSDTARWLAAGGYVDYLMPQLYWGPAYSKNGSTRHALGTLAAQWLAMPRDAGVALYFGLGAYRIGDGDGSDGGAAPWQSGAALCEQLALLESLGGEGAALYRYDSLFGNTAWPQLAAQEAAALAAR